MTDACKKHGGFYLGSIGGPAARLAQDCIKKVEVLEYPELGMEAVWRIEVEDFPAFIVVDDKGNEGQTGGEQAHGKRVATTVPIDPPMAAWAPSSESVPSIPASEVRRRPTAWPG